MRKVSEMQTKKQIIHDINSFVVDNTSVYKCLWCFSQDVPSPVPQATGVRGAHKSATV